MKTKQLATPYRSITTDVVSNNPNVRKTLLDIMGPPKAMKSKHTFRTRNYFYRVFNNIGSQLAVINQGLKDNGPVRTYQFK